MAFPLERLWSRLPAWGRALCSSRSLPRVSELGAGDAPGEAARTELLWECLALLRGCSWALLCSRAPGLLGARRPERSFCAYLSDTVLPQLRDPSCSPFSQTPNRFYAFTHWTSIPFASEKFCFGCGKMHLLKSSTKCFTNTPSFVLREKVKENYLMRERNVGNHFSAQLEPCVLHSQQTSKVKWWERSLLPC